jgi:type IV pilus assembly protein PilY1
MKKLKDRSLVTGRLLRPVMVGLCGVVITLFASIQFSYGSAPLAQQPMFSAGGVDAPPLTMLVMGRDHTLYYEAYNDASDLNGDGVLDVGYQPDDVDYFGYFSSSRCYDYESGVFRPIATTGNKQCSTGWSGDFLNYLTTARIDALRKVLYGGRRVIDTESRTVLERAYIPQDAHSWGKEYRSIDHDGYDIRDYAPLELPQEGTRHLFANVTLAASDGDKMPLLRVLNDSRFRIWEWVAIERPVAGSNCINSSTSCTTSSTTQRGSHPSNASQFQTLIGTWGTSTQHCGTGAISGQIIDTSGSNNNPFTGADYNQCRQDYYLTLIRGQIYAATAGDYAFATNGDDAVEVLIDGQVVTGWYGGHGNRNDSSAATRAANTGSVQSITLTAGWHDLEFHHEENTGGDNWELLWQPPGGLWEVVPMNHLRGSDGEDSLLEISTYRMERILPASDMTDYVVRVDVCVAGYEEASCRRYPSGQYKPVGLLQNYGEGDHPRMLFGLLSGSYTHPYNMRGGVLRKNIESITNEIDPNTGMLTDVVGIIRTIDRFRIVDYRQGTAYSYQGGWLTTAAMADSNTAFPDWGNPLAEMLYETLRYFSGQTEPTAAFTPNLVSNQEQIRLRDYADSSNLYLPAPGWIDPYTRDDDPALYCAPGAQLIISDVNPSYDTDQVPGSRFNSFSGDISGLDAAAEADTIWDLEHGGASEFHFIGQVDNDYDGAPTAKLVTGLGSIRGLSPSEPTKRGGYYSAGIARFGFKQDLRSDLLDKQDINTFAVALASPLPRIDIPVGTGRITLVPFAKSVGGYSINATKGAFQPTNTIVDFFVDTFANTDPAGSDADATVNGGRPFVRFRINFEDVEQGADHDMDAIVIYELAVTEEGLLAVNLTSEYAAGSIMHHLGYVISGTTADGVYLEVRDKDTAASSDPNYFLDTPTTLAPGACDQTAPPASCTEALPLYASRLFTPDATAHVATVLENPLWYAAKYGSEGNEGLGMGEDSPNYFLVTNAGYLQRQLEAAFNRIILLTRSSSASVATSSTRATTDTTVYQAIFDTEDWSGDVQAYNLFADQPDVPVWEAAAVLPSWNQRRFYTWSEDEDAATARGVLLNWDALNDGQQAALQNEPTLLDWLKGDQSLESTHAEQIEAYRPREVLLGDIVNSNPFYIGAPKDVGYGHLPTGTPGREMYTGISGTEFIQALSERLPMIYVGANDGFLHGFSAIDGVEQFAYLPNALFAEGNLPSLASKGYQHRYFTDGSVSVGQAYIHDAWRSILIGTPGAGGQSVFALDVTYPESFTANQVLWEVIDDDLGYLVQQMTSSPVIGHMTSGHWAALVGNGYDSDAGAWLYCFDLAARPPENSPILRKIRVADELDNGLSAVALIRDEQKTIVGAYAGDLYGRLWKFDLTDSSPSAWQVAYGGAPLFQAFTASGQPQPITGPLEIGLHPLGGYLIYFGTGSYMRLTDPADVTVQSAYAIWDNAALTTDPVTGRPVWQGGTAITGQRQTVLLQQVIIAETDQVPNDPEHITWRVFSNETMDWGTRSNPTKRGWFIDLTSPVADSSGAWNLQGQRLALGERIIARPDLLPYTRLVLFTSLIPSDPDDADPCETGGGRSWLFALDALTGGAVDHPVFDLNDDHRFDENDLLTIEFDIDQDGTLDEVLVPGSGMQLDYITNAPIALIREEDHQDTNDDQNNDNQNDDGQDDGQDDGDQNDDDQDGDQNDDDNQDSGTDDEAESSAIVPGTGRGILLITASPDGQEPQDNRDLNMSGFVREFWRQLR